MQNRKKSKLKIIFEYSVVIWLLLSLPLTIFLGLMLNHNMNQAASATAELQELRVSNQKQHNVIVFLISEINEISGANELLSRLGKE